LAIPEPLLDPLVTAGIEVSDEPFPACDPSFMTSRRHIANKPGCNKDASGTNLSKRLKPATTKASRNA
jgi:hypothetical protein